MIITVLFILFKIKLVSVIVFIIFSPVGIIILFTLGI